MNTGALPLLSGAILVAVLATVALLAAHQSPDRSGQLTSYYFRATIDVEGEGTDDVLGAVLGWYQAPDRWRWDFGDPALEPDAGSALISDGETVVYYDRETNTYTRQALADYNAGLPPDLTEGPPVLPASASIGWLVYGDRERFIQAWKDTEVQIADGGVVAGRDTDVLRFIGSGVKTLWLDREFPFVLKSEARDPAGIVTVIKAEIVELALNEPVDEGVFRFEPPPSALEVQPSASGSSSGSGTSSVGGSAVSAPDGFRTPVYVPDGYVVVRTEGSQSAMSSRETGFVARWESAGGEYLDLRQQYRAGGLSETQRAGLPATIGGTQGYDQSAGGEARLVWAEGDVVVTLSADALSLDELVRIAESLR